MWEWRVDIEEFAESKEIKDIFPVRYEPYMEKRLEPAFEGFEKEVGGMLEDVEVMVVAGSDELEKEINRREMEGSESWRSTSQRSKMQVEAAGRDQEADEGFEGKDGGLEGVQEDG